MGEAIRDRAEAQAFVAAPRSAVAELFWDIAAWHAIWHKIDDVDVRYDDGVHQEFAMGVQRDGRREDVRTIRYRRGSGDIEFFSPTPPPAMVVHNGSWRFDDSPRHGGCRIRARRDYELIAVAGEPDRDFLLRRARYRRELEDRLRAILACFVEYFDAAARPIAPGVTA